MRSGAQLPMLAKAIITLATVHRAVAAVSNGVASHYPPSQFQVMFSAAIRITRPPIKVKRPKRCINGIAGLERNGSTL